MSLLVLLLFCWIILFLIFYRYHSGHYYSVERFQQTTEINSNNSNNNTNSNDNRTSSTNSNNSNNSDNTLDVSDSSSEQQDNSQENQDSLAQPAPLLRVNENQDQRREISSQFLSRQNVNREPDVKNCLFVPRGDTLQSCIDRCQFPEDRNLWGGNNCTNNNCTKICSGCRNKKHCKWTRNENVGDDNTIQNPPPKQEITVLAGDSIAKVMWTSYENANNKNTSFMIKYFKTYKPFEGVKVANLVVDSESKKNFTYTLENLENNEFYSVGVFAINDTDIGPCSNVEQIVPKENKRIISN